jgi:hypothetical protein
VSAPHAQLLLRYARARLVPVVILVADGARPDTLRAALDRGALPALARLRDEGGLFDITTVFPSVTGPAYTPFVMGRHPATVGLPGLRWYDRSRTLLRWPYARSYVGLEYRRFATDLAPEAPTLWESTPRTLGALPVIARGLPLSQEVGRGVAYSSRAVWAHVRGDVRGWLAIDRATGAEFVQRWAAEQPAFAMAAFTGVDKTSHAFGPASEAVGEALAIVEDVAAGIRQAAEAAGTWAQTHLWIVSDHGHEPVHTHEDLAAVVRAMGYRTAAHPFEWPRRADVAVMVSGNAMAHVYVDLAQRTRPGWTALRNTWTTFANALVARRSVDVALLPELDGACLVQSAAGTARVSCVAARWSYTPLTGDPFGVGALHALDHAAAHEAMAASDYPDALVQCTSIAASARSGDLILSSAAGWDFRARWEPIPHVSSHGSLRRAHMAVPLLVNRPPARTPRRTTDIGATAFMLGGTTTPRVLDGHAWLGVEPG